METVELDRLVYLTILGAALLGWFVAENRGALGRSFRMALVWGLIFLGAIAAAGLWEDVRDDLIPRQAVLEGGVVTVPRSPDGHFHLTLDVNGVPVDFLVDTGASQVVLTHEDAERAGFDIDGLIYTGTAQTANGRVRIAQLRADEVALGDVRFRDIPVAINEGEMFGSLLGMEYLRRFDRLEIAGDRLTLVP